MLPARLLKRIVILQMLVMFKYFMAVILWSVMMQGKEKKERKDVEEVKCYFSHCELHESVHADLPRSAAAHGSKALRFLISHKFEMCCK